MKARMAREGEWARASDVLEERLEADRGRLGERPGADPGWVDHLGHQTLLTWTAMMEGRYELALDTASSMRRETPEEALAAFETSLERTPNRRNALAGVERARAAIDP